MEAKIKLIQNILPEIMRYNFRKPEKPVTIEVSIPITEEYSNEYKLHIYSWDRKNQTHSLWFYKDLRVITIAELKKVLAEVRKFIKENR